MGGGSDDVALSDWERSVLADLEVSLHAEDPDLARRLGVPGARRLGWLRLRQPRLSPRGRLAGATALALVGVVVLLATFTRSVWLGFAGVCLLGAGAAGLLELVPRHLPPGRRSRLIWREPHRRAA